MHSNLFSGTSGKEEKTTKFLWKFSASIPLRNIGGYRTACATQLVGKVKLNFFWETLGKFVDTKGEVIRNLIYPQLQ